METLNDLLAAPSALSIGPRLAATAGLLLGCISACGSPAGHGTDVDLADADGICTSAELAELERQLADALDAAAVDTTITTNPDLTLLLEADDGRRFTHSHGASTPTTSYESASTSKLVSAVVILDLVDEGVLSLESTAHDLIPFWTAETAVTLRDLLSFRSGFNDDPPCINRPAADFEGCVEVMYDDNVGAGIASGTQFYYSSTHLQIAGLMAMKATGKTWSEIFDAWKAKTGLFPTGVYDLPSMTNPRLAGGMHWTGDEYLALLRALYKGTVLTTALRGELLANQRGSATVASSPVVAAVDEDWAYGLGNWLECPTARGAGTFDCGAGHRNSSPGAYGAYPFLDFDHHYVGVLARQGTLGTFRDGLAIFRAVQDLASRWADNRCRR